MTSERKSEIERNQFDDYIMTFMIYNNNIPIICTDIKINTETSISAFLSI